MDVWTKLSVVFLVVVFSALAWWCIASSNHQRRRVKAAAWAQEQTTKRSSDLTADHPLKQPPKPPAPVIPEQRQGKHHEHSGSAVTVADLLEKVGRDVAADGPAAGHRVTTWVRPYARDDAPTVVPPVVHPNGRGEVHVLGS